MPRYSSSVVAYRSATDLGLQVELTSVSEDGTAAVLAYWDFEAGGWSPVAGFDYRRNVRPLQRKSDDPASPDSRVQLLTMPTAVLADPKALASIYTIGDGERKELVESVPVATLRNTFDPLP